ncbi:MAG: DUF167 domain-containing protein [Patescibacteria group bacterium]
MKISVTIRACAGEEKVEDLGLGKYKVWVREPPEKGSANKALILALSKFLKVSRSQITILSGHTARNKIVEIAG